MEESIVYFFMEKVAILDCGGQYTKVIDRRVRELLINTDIFPLDVKADELKGYSAIILSGGPDGVYDEDAKQFDSRMFELGIPVLGLCYGMQIMAHHFGGEVSPCVKKEYGETEIEVDTRCPLFIGLDKMQTVIMSHGDSVAVAPKGWVVVGKSGDTIAAIARPEDKFYGLQFHPEVELTVNGTKMFETFLRRIAGLKEEYKLDDRIETSIAHIRKVCGDKKVISLISGGVDSAVTTALLLKALPNENVIGIHVDTGLMRKGESDLVVDGLKALGLKHLVYEKASADFFDGTTIVDGKEMKGLRHLSDPEDKRAFIGHMFIDVVRRATANMDINFDETILAQGTLRPDLIESGNPDVSKTAKKIKTHHNDVDIIRKARAEGRVVETNWDWHKDEVRKVGKMLGLPEEIVMRQPFPGPGLGVRIIAAESFSSINAKDAEILSGIMKGHKGYYGKIVPVKNVGVQGDSRSFKDLCVLSHEGDNWDWDSLYALGKQIVETVHSVTRIAFVLNRSGELEFKTFPMAMTPENANLLREIDSHTTKTFQKGADQTFVVLAPMGLGKEKSAVVRSIVTSDFMTARPMQIGKEISKVTIKEFVKKIEAAHSNDIEYIMYDVTAKPPATVEWQ